MSGMATVRSSGSPFGRAEPWAFAVQMAEVEVSLAPEAHLPVLLGATVKPMISTFVYYCRRGHQEQVAAINARSQRAAFIHRRLCEMYTARAISTLLNVLSDVELPSTAAILEQGADERAALQCSR